MTFSGRVIQPGAGDRERSRIYAFFGHNSLKIGPIFCFQSIKLPRLSSTIFFFFFSFFYFFFFFSLFPCDSTPYFQSSIDVLKTYISYILSSVAKCKQLLPDQPILRKFYSTKTSK